MAVTNAICAPSGDQWGFESGPSCATTTMDLLESMETTEMSAVPPSAGSLVVR